MFTHPEIGTYLERRTARTFAGRPAVFLDRDGVVVEETNYLHEIRDVRFIPGVAQAVALANSAGLPVVMITNQAGIGRGLYGWSEFRSVQEHIHAQFAAHGAHFDMVVACAYHEAGKAPYDVAGHPWRKPGPGMLVAAQQLLGFNLAASHVIGDTMSDLRAGHAAGLAGGTLVNTGHGPREWREHAAQFDAWADGSFAASRSETAAHALMAKLGALTA